MTRLTVPAGFRSRLAASAAEPLADAPILVFGVQRSGTSMLGNIVGSFEGAEYEYEPWLWGNLPILAEAGGIRRDSAIELLRGCTSELLNCHLLGRSINLRPGDLSRKDLLISRREIQRRWKDVSTREDVKKLVRRENRTLAIKLVNFQPFLPYFFQAFPRGKAVHIIRDPFEAADSAVKKGWFDLEAFRRTESADLRRVIMRRGREIHLPWWVPSRGAERFLRYSEFERALWGWTILMDSLRKSMPSPAPERYLEIRFEEFLLDPGPVLRNLSDFLGRKPTATTRRLLGEMDSRKASKTRPRERIPPELSRAVKRLGFNPGRASS